MEGVRSESAAELWHALLDDGGHPLLRPRECEALRVAAAGGSAKDVAVALEISPSNARALLSTATRKLGLRGRADLYRVDPRGANESTPAPTDHPLLTRLSAAEREVARLILLGATNAEISRERRVSVRTVANQVASILRKLRLRARADLVATVFGTALRARVDRNDQRPLTLRSA